MWSSSTAWGQGALEGAARVTGIIDVREYGAKCDQATDDGPAFNLAIAALRATAIGGSPAHGQLSWAGCDAVIKTTINLTGLKSNSVSIDGQGLTVEW